MISSLTDEQVGTFPNYVQKWIAIGCSCDKLDTAAAIEAVNQIYTTAQLPPPKWFLGPFNNPIEAMVAEKILQQFIGESFANNKELNDKVAKLVKEAIRSNDGKNLPEVADINHQSFGSQESWLSFYDFFENECQLECCKKLEGLKRLSKVCGWWTPLAGGCLLQHRPEKIQFDDRNRIHCTDGPAIKFRGDELCNVYAVHGVRVTKNIVNRDYTAADIDKETNVEVRRIMIELYGQAKYLLDTSAEVVCVDDWGTLFKKEQSNDEVFMMVKVLNSTPEPDGTFKDYFIRVDPKQYGGLKTAQAAIASTWRNKDGSLIFQNPLDYNPDIET